MSDLAQMLARFPRLELAHLPAPLEPLKRLSAHLGGPAIRERVTFLRAGGMPALFACEIVLPN